MLRQGLVLFLVLLISKAALGIGGNFPITLFESSACTTELSHEQSEEGNCTSDEEEDCCGQECHCICCLHVLTWTGIPSLHVNEHGEFSNDNFKNIPYYHLQYYFSVFHPPNDF